MIEVNCHGGRIGRFRWANSSFGGSFRRCGQFNTQLHPGNCGWDEAWPDWHSWPVSPWGKGDPVDERWREFAAFGLWLDRQLESRGFDRIDLNITERIELFSIFCAVFNCGIYAGRNPWDWALRIEQQTTTTTEAT
jgi:hypothetical protein